VEWRKKKHHAPSIVEWWEQCKRKLRGFCSAYSRQVRADTRAMLEFRTECLNELYANQQRTPLDMHLIRKHKKAINTLLIRQMGGIIERSKCDRPCSEEEPSIHHVAAQHKRSRQNNLESLEGESGEIHDTQEKLEKYIHQHFTAKLSTSGPPPPASSPFLDELQSVVTPEDNDALLAPITKEELHAALLSSPRHKSPGDDGLTAEFYIASYEILEEDMLAVFNHMLEHRTVSRSHKTGVMVLVPKIARPEKIGHLRPVTLLNTDGKVFTRIMTKRLMAIQGRLVHPNQVHAGAERNIYAALSDIRDVIGELDLVNRNRKQRDKTQACIISMDIHGAFDHVNHEFLWEVMRRYGLAEEFIDLIKSLYEGAVTRIKINGVLSEAILLLSGVKQGCPLSMILFNIIVSPLIRLLDKLLVGVDL